MTYGVYRKELFVVGFSDEHGLSECLLMALSGHQF